MPLHSIQHSTSCLLLPYKFTRLWSHLVLLFVCLFVWLCWVFVAVRGLSLVAASGGHSSSRCAGLSLSRSLLLQSTGSRRAGSVHLMFYNTLLILMGYMETKHKSQTPVPQTKRVPVMLPIICMCSSVINANNRQLWRNHRHHSISTFAQKSQAISIKSMKRF